jgi:GTPase SAR1 family protein
MAAEPFRATPESSLSSYQQARAKLLELMAEMATLHRPGLRPEPELAGKLAAERFELLVVGQYKRGKTCLINALIRDDLLPTAVIPATSVLTVLTYGSEVSIEVLYKDGSVGQIGRERLAEFVTESGNPENHRGVRELLIRHPAPLLRGGVRIIDTPGIGSLHRHNTAAAYSALPRCDAALFLLAADQPLGQAELEFLDDLRPHARRLFFLLNKIDLLSPTELAEAEQFTRRELARAMDGNVQLFSVSARQALGGRSWVDAGLERQSRIAQFRAELESFLLHEKGRVLLVSVAVSLLQTLRQGELELRLERQALHTPVDRINHAIQQFEKRRRSLQTEWQELAYHITMATERLASRLGERLLEAALPELKRRLLGEFDQRARDHRELNPKQLDEDLSGFIERRVGHCYAEWAEREKQQLAQELGAIAGEAVSRAASLTAELQHYASELLAAGSEFQIDSPDALPLPTGDRAPLLAPAGFDLLADGLWLDLPRWIGGRFARIRSTLDRWARRRVIERRRSELTELTDMAAGRIRGNLVDHIQRETARSLAALSEQLEKTAAGIERALEQGRRRRIEKTESLAEHLAQLIALQDQVESCICRVEEILNDVASIVRSDQTQSLQTMTG